jgi:hypothetical protein
MGESDVEGDQNKQQLLTGAALWRRVALLIWIPMAIGSVLAYAAKLPGFVIAWANVMFVVFILIPLLTGMVDEAGRVNARRAIAFFGVIPGVAAVSGILMAALGLPATLILYLFGAVIVLGNCVYWVWFDRRKAR